MLCLTIKSMLIATYINKKNKKKYACINDLEFCFHI